MRTFATRKLGACSAGYKPVWTAAAAIHREKNTVEAAAAAGLQPQQAAANKLSNARRRHTSHTSTVQSAGCVNLSETVVLTPAGTADPNDAALAAKAPPAPALPLAASSAGQLTKRR
jgi:hypothetical protein